MESAAKMEQVSACSSREGREWAKWDRETEQAEYRSETNRARERQSQT